MNWIAQRQRSLNGTDETGILAESRLAVNVESVKLPTSRLRGPTFHADTEVAMEEIFRVDTAAPGVIRFKITVIFPVICREYVGAPQSDVPFRVPIPFGAGWRLLDLFHFLHFLA